MTRVTGHKPDRPIWFELTTTDPEAARAFYAAVLDWTYDISGPEFGGYALGLTDGLNAAGIGQTQPGDASPPAWTVYFGVSDVAASSARVAKQGGTILVPPMDVAALGKMAVCQDPTGAVFGMWQPQQHIGAQILNEPGAMAWSEVNTRDASAAAAFYTSVFGLKDSVMEIQGTPYHMLNTAEGPACGVLQMNAEWGDMPPHWMTYFAVKNADAAKAAVLANGGTVPYGPFDSPYGRIIVAMDPQGAAVSFIELADAPPAQ